MKSKVYKFLEKICFCQIILEVCDEARKVAGLIAAFY
jgi:hypothetical protein